MITKNIIVIAAMLVGLLLGFGVCEAINSDPIGWMTARAESQKVINVCRTRGIYNRRFPYAEAVYYVRKHAAMFDLDRKLVYAVIIKESEFNPTAKNINWNSTADRGLMQVNECWNDVIMSDSMLQTMFRNDTNRIRSVEDFIYDIQHNIFIGCFILKEKLALNKGLMVGVARYNGSGYAADKYASSVIDIYGEISKEY